MEIKHLQNSTWQEITYKKSDLFLFQNNGWNCLIRPFINKKWIIETWPIGYNDSDEYGQTESDTFDNAFTEAIEHTYFKPDCISGIDSDKLFWELRYEGKKNCYYEEEIDKLKIKILYARIKNGHKKHNRIKPTRPLSLQSSWAKLVKHRDKYKCVKCGSADKIQAHHIEHYKDSPNNWELSNGVTLCFDCHLNEH
jgi:hypothetical protein